MERLIGEGAYGKVFLCKNDAQQLVALKQLEMKDKSGEGVPISTLREINNLKTMSHSPNVVQLLDICYTRDDKLYIVLEYVPHDLAGIITNVNLVVENKFVQLLDSSSKQLRFDESIVKHIMYQILVGIEVIHSKQTVHRDLKSTNILLTSKGIVKIADFGLSRTLYHNNVKYTTRTCTLWYRAAELLLGNTCYDYSIDMWSVGVIFAEILRRTPLFPHQNEMDLLSAIYSLCGTPHHPDNNWIEAKQLPLYMEPKASMPNRVYEFFDDFVQCNMNNMVDLLHGLLQLNPKKRPSAKEALQHPWFSGSICKTLEWPFVVKEPRNENWVKQIAKEQEQKTKKRKYSEEETSVQPLVSISKKSKKETALIISNNSSIYTTNKQQINKKKV